MLLDFLLWSNILLAPSIAIVLLARSLRSVATWLLFTTLLSIAIVAYVDLQIFNAPDFMPAWQKYAICFESLIAVSGYFYTKTVFRDNHEIYKGPGFWIAVALATALLAYVFVTPMEDLLFSVDFETEAILFLTKSGFAIYLLLMVYLVFGLVQLERTFAGLHSLQRWGIKLEIIGSGLLLSSFALYFSHSLLYRSINMGYLGVRSVAVIGAILLIARSRLSRLKDVRRLALSRGIAHRSFVLLIVGGYLIILGLVGEGLRYFDVANAKAIFNVILLLGSMLLAGVFLSETLRRRLKVFLHKNFYASKYDYREQWQTFTQKIAEGTSLTEVQISILDFFCEPLACKGAAFYLYDEELSEFLPAAHFNFRRDWRPFTEEDPLIDKLRRKDWIVNLRENNPDLRESLISSLPDDEIFLIVPLFFDDELTGFIMLREQINPAEELTYEDYDLLRMLARQAIAAVQGLRLSEQLTKAREMAAVGKVSTFVLHDLKNQVSGLSLMLDNAREYISDAEFQKDMLETIANTVRNMNELIFRLKNLKEKPTLALSTADLQKIVVDAVDTARGHITIKGERITVTVDEEEIYRVILNLLVNAVEASNGAEPVRVSFGKRDKTAFVEVSDKGCGMSDDFIRDRLFQPFETTKKHGFGIGLYQCRQIMESHGGSIEVVSREGEGTTFTLLFPVAL